jgi:SAM-dependent methyltransferase
LIPEGKFKDFLRFVKRALFKRRPFPAVGKVDLGDLERVTPVSDNWGFDRGKPVDRIYIEKFIAGCRADICGHVLEVYKDDYTTRYGGDRVTKSDILHDEPGLERATMVFDLVNSTEAPAGVFDCIICTQTLQLIYDVHAALASLHRMLKPGGVLLLTVPGISATPHRGMGGYSDYWRFTSPSVHALLARTFDPNDVSVRVYGNVYAATAFLHGLAAEELDADKLAYFDQDYEMLIGARAIKQPAGE